MTPDAATAMETATGETGQAAPAGLPAPAFPAFLPPGEADVVSEVSAVHREVSYAIAIGFRRLAMDIWLPRALPGRRCRWLCGSTVVRSSWGTDASCRPPSPRIQCSVC
jgi:hypothetical protein